MDHISSPIAAKSRHEQELIEDLQHHQWELNQQNEELRRIYAELNVMTERYRDLWNNAPVGYISHLGNGTITAANRRARTLLGNARPFSGNSLLQSYLDQNSQRIFRQHIVNVQECRANATELRLGGNASATPWIRIESSIADGEFRSVITDITSQKQAQLQQLQSHKMDVLHHLSGGIAHDFNNILQVVASYGQLIQSGRVPEHTDELLAEMLEGVNRGTDLTSRLLAFSRRSSLNSVAADLRSIVDDALNIFSTVQEDIQVELCFPEDTVVAEVDENQLQQALLNLCINSRDAMPDGGKLLVEVDRRSVRSHETTHGDIIKAGDYGVITIADSGIGMDAATLAQVFEPFFTTKGSGSGTGLGLAIVKGILTQHKGSIDVESSPGNGTRIQLFLPLNSRQVVPDAVDTQPPQEDVSGLTGTILFAEDEPAIREALSRTLNAAGFQTILANNGADALRKFQQSDDIDLVLSDIMMPACSGRELCEHIHRQSPSTPVIFLTGYGDKIVDAAFLKKHDVTFLRKPVDNLALLAAIDARLRESALYGKRSRIL